MTFIVADPRRFIGLVVDNGHSARFVQVAASMPLTAQWRRGERARRADLAEGTVIAVFGPDGRYANKVGSSHACAYLSQDERGLRVLSQWIGKPVHERTLLFRAGLGSPANDGDAMFVVEA